MPTLLLCIFTIIGLSQVITYEYQNQMHKITQTSYRGNHYILNIKLHRLCQFRTFYYFLHG